MNLATKNTNDFTVTGSGEAFISQSAISRLTGIPQQTLSDWIRKKSVDVNTNNINQLDAKSLQEIVIVGSSKYPSCQQFMCKLLEAGAKAYIYHEAGYELQVKPKMTQLEMLAEGFANMARLEAEQSVIKAEIAQIKDRQDQLDGDTQYMTALAYCRKHKIPAPLKVANKLGRDCAKHCKQYTIKIGTVPDERWGSVNSYPVKILDGLYK